eukprot:752812-Hanusia_phi.AAC.8
MHAARAARGSSRRRTPVQADSRSGRRTIVAEELAERLASWRTDPSGSPVVCSPASASSSSLRTGASSRTLRRKAPAGGRGIHCRWLPSPARTRPDRHQPEPVRGTPTWRDQTQEEAPGSWEPPASSRPCRNLQMAETMPRRTMAVQAPRRTSSFQWTDCRGVWFTFKQKKGSASNA